MLKEKYHHVNPPSARLETPSSSLLSIGYEKLIEITDNLFYPHCLPHLHKPHAPERQ